MKFNQNAILLLFVYINLYQYRLTCTVLQLGFENGSVGPQAGQAHKAAKQRVGGGRGCGSDVWGVSSKILF